MKRIVSSIAAIATKFLADLLVGDHETGLLGADRGLTSRAL
jgi:hypothetical protein